MKKSFNLTARDSAAKQYLTSKEFLDEAKRAITSDMVIRNKSYAEFQPDMTLDSKADMPYLQQAFLELKKEYPELDNIRLCDVDVIIDSKPNTFLRRSAVRWF